MQKEKRKLTKNPTHSKIVLQKWGYSQVNKTWGKSLPLDLPGKNAKGSASEWKDITQ